MTPITPSVPVTAIDKVPVKGQPQIAAQSGAVSALPISPGVGPALSEQERVEKQVKTWVAQTFFGTLMKQMRDSPFKDEMFSGGKGGAAYGSLYDQQVVQRMAVGPGQRLVKSITKSILKSKGIDAKRAYDKAAAPRPVDALQQSSSPFNKPAPHGGPATNSNSFKELPRVPTGLRA